jgi:branched-chain amino acid transport system substrate-binding protein
VASRPASALLRWAIVNLSGRGLTSATLLSFALIAGCTSRSDERVTVTVATTTTTTVREQDSGDGQLVIGALLPISDSVIGQPMLAAVETAVERINAAGGVLGQPVLLVVADEGSTTASTTTSIQTLIDSDVDAVVGPASSLTAVSTLDRLVSAGVVACSPSASALALDEFPDDGLFFRTVPSDSLQARAIAQAADQTGAQRVAVAYVDDAYGRGFADAVQGWLDNVGVSVMDREPFPTDADDVSAQARRITDSDAQVAVVLANANDVTRFLEALDDEDTSKLSAVVINDSLRNPAAPQRIEALSASLRSRIVGLAPQAQSGDPNSPFDPDGPFAANAYDCTNLIALAAVGAGSDAARSIAGALPSVSVSGSVCQSFADCNTAINAGLQVDYNGPSGITDISSRTGAPSRAVFERFVFDSSGRDVLERSIVVGS